MWPKTRLRPTMWVQALSPFFVLEHFLLAVTSWTTLQGNQLIRLWPSLWLLAPRTPVPFSLWLLAPRTTVPSSLGLLAPRTPALTRRWGSPENFCSSCMLQVEQIVAGSTFFLIFLTLTIAMLIVEGWSLPHALWFSLISVTTIGFGGQSKEFLLCVLLSSLGIWHCFSTVVPSALGAGEKAAVLEKRG